MSADEARIQLRAWLTARGPGITAGVRWLATEYGCSEQAVWKWLSGERPLPGWLRRELGTARPPGVLSAGQPQ